MSRASRYYQAGQRVAMTKLAGDTPPTSSKVKETTKVPPEPPPTLPKYSPMKFKTPALQSFVERPPLSERVQFPSFKGRSMSSTVSPDIAKKVFDYFVPSALGLETPSEPSLSQGKLTFGKSFTF